MSVAPALRLTHESARHVEIATGDGALLFRYVYAPETPANEAPRPYAHPLRTIAGDPLTNFRPNDHPWHHALSLTVTNVDGVNFWGGPTYRAADGYQWRQDHGRQIHQAWTALTADRLEAAVDWFAPTSGQRLLAEKRTLQPALVADGWTLRWISELTNVSGRALVLGNYHSLGGLAGSHYTGLQFRGARDLIDDHGDATLGIRADGDLAGEAAVHGASARWMEWSCQHDGSLRRTRIRFENLAGPLSWFVRAKNPIAGFAFHREQSHSLAADGALRLDHRLTFVSA